MKRFISLVFVYAFVVLLLLLPGELYKMYFIEKFETIAGYETRVAVKKSKTKTSKKVKRLILGDSTGHALYPTENEYDNVVSLACNQAITMAGHYFLLKNYLETNVLNLPEEVILLYSPYSLSNNVDKFAYQYFLKNFPLLEYRSLYSNHLYTRIQSIPWYWTANLPFIRTSDYTPRKSVPILDDSQNISVLSLEYLLLLDSLTNSYHIPLYMYSPPMRDDRKQEISRRLDDLRVVCKNNLSDLVKTYIESVTYTSYSNFCDDVHLIDSAVPKDYLQILNE